MTANNIASYPQSGSLPTATAAGQVPVSTGAGTTYVAGTAGGSYTLISSQVLGAPAATVSFASIPQTYKHLKLVVAAGSSQSSVDNLAFRLNGDTGANYNTQFMSVTGSTTPAGSVSSAATSGLLGNVQGTSTANVPGVSEVTLFGYTSTVFYKTFLGNSVSFLGNGNGSLIMSSAEWTNTAAVTSITLLLPSASNFVTGSVFSLYGLS